MTGRLVCADAGDDAVSRPRGRRCRDGTSWVRSQVSGHLLTTELLRSRGGGRGGGEDQGRRQRVSPLQRGQLEEVGGGRVGRPEVPAQVAVVAVDAGAARTRPRGVPSGDRVSRCQGADCPGRGTRYR